MDLSKYTKKATIKDHAVSGEIFDLYYDDQLDLLITYPQPKGAKLDAYYESDDYISHTDGKRSFFEKMYQFIKNIALKNKLQLINSLHKTGGNLLDIGAGTGDFLLIAKSNGWDTTGVEPNNKARNIAEKKGVAFTNKTEELANHSFDVISMWHVLEHVPDLENQIKELKRLLKPDGSIVIAVPNFHSYDATYYGAFWAGYDVPRHLWHFSKKAIEQLFSKEGLALQKIVPMKFDAFYVSLLSEKYKSGKMNFLQAFLIGLRSNHKAKQNLAYSSHIYILRNGK